VIAIALAMAVSAVVLTPASSAAAGENVSVTAPKVIKKGGAIRVTVTTGDDFTGTGSVYFRKDDVWIKSSVKLVVQNGKATGSWTAASSCSYYVQLAGAGKSAIFSVVVEDSKRYAISSKASAASFASGEVVWVKGTAQLKGKALSSAKILLERKKTGSTKWSTFANIKSSSTGAYSFRILPSSSYAYRARVSGASAVSPPLVFTRVTEDRTLEFRAEQLQSALGAAKSSPKAVAAADLPSGVDAARYQEFAKGRLYEVTKAGVVRTWLVYSLIGNKFTSLHAHTGKLGLPLNDPKCSLLENGCVQRFTGGSLYVNSSKMSPDVYVAYGTYPETEMLAAAWSQVGYEEPSWRHNKYTTWLGSNPAWCMTFTAWTAYATGHSTWVPNSPTYTSYVKTLKKSGRLHYSGTPPLGAALLLDWNNGTPVHSALLSSISGKYIYTLEGNTTDGSGDPQRGVYYRKRELSDIWAWYIPSQP